MERFNDARDDWHSVINWILNTDIWIGSISYSLSTLLTWRVRIAKIPPEVCIFLCIYFRMYFLRWEIFPQYYISEIYLYTSGQNGSYEIAATNLTWVKTSQFGRNSRCSCNVFAQVNSPPSIPIQILTLPSSYRSKILDQTLHRWYIWLWNWCERLH